MDTKIEDASQIPIIDLDKRFMADFRGELSNLDYSRWEKKFLREYSYRAPGANIGKPTALQTQGLEQLRTLRDFSGHFGNTGYINIENYGFTFTKAVHDYAVKCGYVENTPEEIKTKDDEEYVKTVVKNHVSLCDPPILIQYVSANKKNLTSNTLRTQGLAELRKLQDNGNPIGYSINAVKEHYTIMPLHAGMLKIRRKRLK
jgi:hypothetical protein